MVGVRRPFAALLKMPEVEPNMTLSWFSCGGLLLS